MEEKPLSDEAKAELEKHFKAELQHLREEDKRERLTRFNIGVMLMVCIAIGIVFLVAHMAVYR